MKKNLKYFIVFLLALAVVGLYYGKNISSKEDGGIAEITSEDSIKAPALLELSTATCPYCREMEKTLNEMKDDYKGKINIYKVDLNDSPIFAQKYQVRGVPTLIFIDEDNNFHQKVEGLISREQVEQILDGMGIK